MKFILTSLLLLITTFAFTQKKGATMRDFDSLPGNWTGQFIYYTSDAAGVTQTTVQTKLEIVNKVDSLVLNFTPVAANSKTSAFQSSLRIFDDGKQLFYDSHEFDIVAVRRVGQRLTIIADREGTDDKKDATIRETFVIFPGVLNVTTEVKYDTAEKFIVRNKLELKKI